MQLQKQFSNELVVLTLNVDFDGDGEPSPEILEKISKTLSHSNITCENYVARTPMESVLAEFDFFGLPAALLYDRNGNVIQKFDGEVDIENGVAPAIASRK